MLPLSIFKPVHRLRDTFQGGGAQGGGGLGGGGDPFGGGGGGGGGGVDPIVCDLPNVVNNFPVVDLPDTGGAVQFAYVIPPSCTTLGGTCIDGIGRRRQLGNKCQADGLGPTLRYDTYNLVFGGCCFFELYLVNGGQTVLPITQIDLPVGFSYRVPAGMRVVENFGNGALRLINGYDPVQNPVNPGTGGYPLGVGPNTIGMTFPNGGTITVVN